jgi:hypothetical protein
MFVTSSFSFASALYIADLMPKCKWLKILSTPPDSSLHG